MLTDSQRQIVRSTVPLLETGGEALTTHFYRIMLDEFPVVRPLFNQAHQASGEQPRALANGVLAYARHIDHLEALGDLAAQIVQKHVSLQVQPEHYPIVGQCLLRAIREVLGPDVATDEVVDAWAAAYQQLADLLIGAEEQVYASTAAAPGGWRGARPFRIAGKVRESSEIVSFHLAPVDGGPVVAHQPGQYIGVRLSIDGEEHRRNYSLSAAPDGHRFRISVKREPEGRVSNHLHDAMREGDTLDVFPPAGHFTLQPGQRPIVMISGGVGITPLLAMLEPAIDSGRDVTFIHCARNADVHAFRERIDALAEREPRLKRYYCYEQPSPHVEADAVGLIDERMLARWLPATRDVDAYFLGPKPFMRVIKRGLQALGVPETQTRFEFFGPAATLA
ncbi:MAG: NO-inducible flavohemoprotein [Burkholderiaceae bacterium]